MICKHCKAEMKKIGQTTGWVQKHFLWCPECGTFLKEEHGFGSPEETWYKPGYLFEQEVI